MKPIDDETLEKMPVVANCCMNRERELRGTNGYETELKLDPLVHLNQVLHKRSEPTFESPSVANQQLHWLDLCCGTGRALMIAADICLAEQRPIHIEGIDLVGHFAAHEFPNLQLTKASLSDWTSKKSFNLITCVHGLHYVGDKLGLLERIVRWLKPEGLFVGNLDLQNLRLNAKRDDSKVASLLRSRGFEYSTRSRILRWQQEDLNQEIRFALRYAGADPEAGPNYTKQPCVDSYYEV